MVIATGKDTEHKVSFDDLRDQIIKSAHYQEMQTSLRAPIKYDPTIIPSRYVTTMGIGGGVLGGVVGHEPFPPSLAYQESPAEDRYIVVNASEIECLKASLAEAKRELAERDEMIEALVADMEEIEVLRAENEALREEAFPLHTADPEGWIEWRGGSCPVTPGNRIVEVRLGDGENNSHAAHFYRWQWTHGGKMDDITTYRIVG